MNALVLRLIEASGLLGRTTRTRLLAFILVCLFANVVLFVVGVEAMHGRIRSGAGVAMVQLLAAALPWIGTAAGFVFLWIAIRRLHDQDRPGWLALIPSAIGALAWQMRPPAALAILVLLVFLIALFLPGTVGPNRFGPDPRGWRSRDHYDAERRIGRAS